MAYSLVAEVISRALAAALAAACFAASAAPRPADGRLAYLQSVDKGCQVGIWDSKSKTSRILGSLPECAEAVSVTSHEQALVLIFPASIRLVDIGSGKIGDPIPMPADALTKTRDTEESLAGYTADGTLALRLFGMGSDNRNVRQLFLYRDRAWTKVDEKPCGDYADQCPAQLPIEARQLDDAYGIGPDGLFNESLTADPYVLHRSIKNNLPDDEAPPDEDVRPTHVTLTFHVYGKDTQLLFDTVPGEDTAGTYTFGLKLLLPDARTLTITTEQYGSTLMGHYLFYHGFFGDGVRLYDVGNGEVVLGKLSTGGWLESPPPVPGPGSTPLPN